MIHYKYSSVDGKKIFYREAGPVGAPAMLLLHGFPTSSHMFRNLIPSLAESYRVVAPDLPGFGFSIMVPLAEAIQRLQMPSPLEPETMRSARRSMPR